MAKEEKVKGFKRTVKLEDVKGNTKATAWTKTREEIKYKRMMRHKNTSFITTHQHHQAEGNNDENPNRYL